MFLHLFATFLVTLFFSVGNSVKEVPQRILQPHCANYIIERDDNVITGGYYTLNSKDNALYYWFATQGLSWSTINPNNYSRFYICFFTTFSEGIVDYYYSTANTSIVTSINELNNFLGNHWTSLDYFLFEIFDIEYFTSTYHFRNYARYYGIGEQMLGTLSYFDDNIPFNFNTSVIPDYRLHVLDIPNYATLFESQSDELSSVIHISDSDTSIFYTREYTETKPNLLSFGTNMTTSLDYEAYLYSFHCEFTFSSPNYLFTSSLFADNYRFVFGFTYPNNQNYNSGFQEGYTKGYDEGSSEGYQNGYDEGYDLGYDNAKDDYYDSRYSEGYYQGAYDESQLSNKYTFANLFGALADTPIMILRSLLGFEVFGTNAMTILMSMVTACIALFVIRKII